MLNIMQKQCLHCKQTKDASKFRRDKKTDDGYLIWCKGCKGNYGQEWGEKYREHYYKKNKDKIRIRAAEKYKRNREQILARGRKWHREHPEHTKAYREKHKERDRAQGKKYREEHQEQILERGRKWNHANKDKIRERTRRYRKTPHGRLVRKATEYRRRARLENCEVNDFTAEQARLLLEKSTRCPICGERFLKDDKKALDHIVPLSKGGNNTLLNIRVSHFSCNVRKGNRHYANYGDGQLLLIPRFQESPFKKPEPIILTEKKCFHCQIIKSIGMFREDKARRDGHFGACKRCMKIYQRKQRKEYFAIPENRLRKNEQLRRWHQERYLKDPEHWKKLYYQYHEDNLTYAKKYRGEHKEYYQEHGKKYYRKNRVHCNQVSRKWATKHKERVRENGKRWRAEHPDYMKNYYQAQKIYFFTKILSSKLPVPSSQSPTPESKPQNEITIFFS